MLLTEEVRVLFTGAQSEIEDRLKMENRVNKDVHETHRRILSKIVNDQELSTSECSVHFWSAVDWTSVHESTDSWKSNHVDPGDCFTQ